MSQQFNNLFEYMKSSGSYDSFNSSTLSQYSSIIDTFWKELLDKINTEPDNIFTEPGTTLNSMANSSLFGEISENIDFDDGFNFVTWAQTHEFWNDSVQTLARSGIFLDEASDNDVIIGGISYGDVKYGDAGVHFDQIEECVKAWRNASNQTYAVVRGNDLIESVIKYSNNLNYTNNSLAIALRLLMPKYVRYLEVEDLNRNFWVISQVLTGLCNFIFEDTGLKSILDGMLNEIIQLWQNVEYLWGAYALLSQKPTYTDVHCEVVPVPVDTIRNYIKFDDFEDANVNSQTTPQAALEVAWNKLQYLKNQYTESNLFIIPYFRINNYEHNYYETEYYPGIIYYDRNTDNTTQMYTSTVDKERIRILIAPNNDSYKNKTAILSSSGDKYAGPYAANIADVDYWNMYGMLKTVPAISFNSLQDFTVTLSVHDVGYEQYNNTERVVNTITLTPHENETSQVKTVQSFIPDWDSPVSISSFNPTKGFYMGELATSKKSASTLNITDIQVRPWRLKVEQHAAQNEADVPNSKVAVSIDNQFIQYVFPNAPQMPVGYVCTSSQVHWYYGTTGELTAYLVKNSVGKNNITAIDNSTIMQKLIFDFTVSTDPVTQEDVYSMRIKKTYNAQYIYHQETLSNYDPSYDANNDEYVTTNLELFNNDIILADNESKYCWLYTINGTTPIAIGVINFRIVGDKRLIEIFLRETSYTDPDYV